MVLSSCPTEGVYAFFSDFLISQKLIVIDAWNLYQTVQNMGFFYWVQETFKSHLLPKTVVLEKHFSRFQHVFGLN